MRFLLDTHILLWWFGAHPALSQKALQVITDNKNLVFVSAVTAWEISIKKALGKLTCPDDFEENFEKILLINNFRLLPITIPHAVLAGLLPLHHRDIFDRMLVAQSKIEELTLVTHDQKQALYDVQFLIV